MVMVIIIAMVIGLITGIVLIGLGSLAAHACIIARRTDGPSYIYPVLYQGWLSYFSGGWVLLNGMFVTWVLTVSWRSSTFAKLGTTVAALVGPLEVVLGLLFGYLGYVLLTKRDEPPQQIRRGNLAVVFGVLALYPTLFLFFLGLVDH
jgi:hypothetical protein